LVLVQIISIASPKLIIPWECDGTQAYFEVSISHLDDIQYH